MPPFVGKPVRCPPRALKTTGMNASATSARRTRPGGFRLVELMVVLVIGALLATLAAPRMSAFLQNQRRTTVLNEFVASLALARSEAIKRGLNVSMCRSNTGTSCAGTAWANGWIVFVNLDNDVPATVDAGETVLRVRAFDTPDFALNPAVVYTNFLTYRPTGFINSPGNFVLCDSRGAAAARSIIINNTGRARFSRDVDDDGIHEDASNADLSC